MVADAHVLEPDHVLVVQRRHAHDHAADGDRLEHGVRIERPRAPDVDADVEQLRDGRRGRELEGDRPARIATDRAERLLLVAAIDLDHAAVDVVVELRASLDEALAGRGHALERVVTARDRIDGEAVLAQPLEHAPVRVERDAVERADGVAEQRERPRGGDARVLLPQRSGGRVARVHEHAQPGLEALRVEPLEGRERQVDLSAHLDQRRRRRAAQALRQGLDRAQIGRDVLADRAVAARRAAGQRAVLVDERDREPVDLGLRDVGDVVVEPLLGQQPARSRIPGGQRLVIARVREREHGHEVLDRREPLGRPRADALRRRVRGAQLGMPRLELEQLAVERVVLGIRDLRLVQLVIEPQVPRELVTQPGRALGRILLGQVRHRRRGCRRARRASSRSHRGARRPGRRSRQRPR